MPTLKEMQLEGPEVQEKILAQVYRLDQNVQAMGLGPLDPQQLRETFEKIKAGLVQFVSQQGQAPSTTQPAASRPVAPAQVPVPAPSLPLSTFAEGGLVNDASGQATQQVRNRLGIR